MWFCSNSRCFNSLSGAPFCFVKCPYNRVAVGRPQVSGARHARKGPLGSFFQDSGRFLAFLPVQCLRCCAKCVRISPGRFVVFAVFFGKIGPGGPPRQLAGAGNLRSPRAPNGHLESPFKTAGSPPLKFAGARVGRAVSGVANRVRELLRFSGLSSGAPHPQGRAHAGRSRDVPRCGSAQIPAVSIHSVVHLFVS